MEKNNTRTISDGSMKAERAFHGLSPGPRTRLRHRAPERHEKPSDRKNADEQEQVCRLRKCHPREKREHAPQSEPVEKVEKRGKVENQVVTELSPSPS